MPNEIRYVVIDEHTLAYVIPQQPNRYGILRASILKGATSGRLDGWDFFRGPKQKVRPAKTVDFVEFRVQSSRFTTKKGN